jgi:hypothetical protein
VLKVLTAFQIILFQANVLTRYFQQDRKFLQNEALPDISGHHGNQLTSVILMTVVPNVSIRTSRALVIKFTVGTRKITVILVALASMVPY